MKPQNSGGKAVNAESEKRLIGRFLKGKLGGVDAFSIYQWIERCHAENWWDLAVQLASSLPPNSLKQHYQKRVDYILRECRDFLTYPETEAMGVRDDASSLEEKGHLTGNIAQSIAAGGAQVPALLSLVESLWIRQALEYFSMGKSKLYFYTNANIGAISFLSPKSVYFKLKGSTDITHKADYIGIAIVNSGEDRLPGAENCLGKFYYGFGNMMRLEKPIRLADVKYFSTGRSLLNSVPGACIIRDPLDADLPIPADRGRTL